MKRNNKRSFDNDTIAGIATATGGAIGIIRISGSESIRIARDIFIPANNSVKTDIKSHTFYYGHIAPQGAAIDEVMLVAMFAPKTYTREDVVEIHCHGGSESLRRVFSAVLNAGASAAEPGEFTKRAFLNGRIDLTRAEAVMDIISAVSGHALDVAEQSLRGRIFNEIDKAYTLLMSEIASIEAFLDSPEHAFGVVSDRYDYNALQANVTMCMNDLTDLLKTFDYGRVIRDGVNTVISGTPNAGKSSLLNALLGADRAIVTDIAGTTRDLLTERIIIGEHGLVLNITDTAGIRGGHMQDYVERIGAEKAKTAIKDAEIVLFVIDKSKEITEEEITLAEYIRAVGKNTVCALNKADLTEARGAERLIDIMGSHVKARVDISAKTHYGIDELIRIIEKLCLLGDDTNLRNENTAIITNARHAELLRKAINAGTAALNTIKNGLPEDLAVVDLMESCRYLGQITGKDAGIEMIDEIFKRFCLGK